MSELQPQAPVILPVVYIAGKYRAATPWLVLDNIRTAMEAALQVWKMGGVAICPHANCAMFDGEADNDVWLNGDLELLRRSDAVYLLPGWQDSVGANTEHRLAINLGLPTFEHLGRLRTWVEDFRAQRVGEADA